MEFFFFDLINPSVVFLISCLHLSAPCSLFASCFRPPRAMKNLMWILGSLALAALVQDAAGAHLVSSVKPAVKAPPEEEEKTTHRGQAKAGAVVQAGLPSLAGLQEESAGSGRKEALPSGEDADAPIKKAQGLCSISLIFYSSFRWIFIELFLFFIFSPPHRMNYF